MKARETLQYKLLRLIWLRAGRLSRWAATRMINLIREEDKRAWEDFK